MRAAIEVRPHARELHGWQRDLIDAVFRGRDAIGVLPANRTPADKTTCFLLPALSLPRPTVIVTPRPSDAEEHLPHLARGAAPARLYLTSEQLQSPDCVDLLPGNGSSRIVIDDAPDLRPAYLAIAAVAWRIGRPPILAFVRTEESISDAIMLLGLRAPTIVRPPTEK